MHQLRSHQAELKLQLDRWSGDRPLKILAHVVPGGGKSWLPAIVADRFPHHKLAWFVPVLNLRSQAAESMLTHEIAIWEAENQPDPSRGTRGFVATRQALASLPELYIHEFERHDYIVVFDEVHHAKLSRSGERNELASVIPRLRCPVRMDMTGTLETNDNSLIEGIVYDTIADGWRARPEKSADIYIRYDRKTAITEDALVPIKFYHHDGPVRFIGKNGEVTRTLSDPAKADEHPAALFTALKTDLAIQLLRRGVGHWRENGDQLIVVAASQGDAGGYREVLREIGIDAALAISDEGEQARAAIRAFRRREVKVMVTCAMCYEGLDAPYTSHLVCLTHIRSIPWIEQMLGRCWRWAPGKSQCYAFVPDDPRMREVINHIRAEEVSDVWAPGQDGSGGGEGGPTCIVPISSDIKSMSVGYLDEDVVEGQNRDKVIAAMESLGLSANDPVFAHLMEAVERQSQTEYRQPTILTEADKAMRTRKSIHKLCGRADIERGVDPGTTMKEIHRLAGGVRFKDATLQELEDAAVICSRHCEKFFAR